MLHQWTLCLTSGYLILSFLLDSTTDGFQLITITIALYGKHLFPKRDRCFLIKTGSKLTNTSSARFTLTSVRFMFVLVLNKNNCFMQTCWIRYNCTRCRIRYTMFPHSYPTRVHGKHVIYPLSWNMDNVEGFDWKLNSPG